MIAAIEIYNKPRFAYRDECIVILILNAWELLLKAILSQNGRSIYYPKKRKEPYRTLSWHDALGRAQALFPRKIAFLPVESNLRLVAMYRDNATHFYNKPGFGSIIWALAQTNIVNFKDLLFEVFHKDLSQEISWQLLPLGLKHPIDPIQYISGKSGNQEERDAAVRHFLGELKSAVKAIQESGEDTGRLLTVFTVKLESTKKITDANLVVGVKKMESESEPLVIEKRSDPNVTHPLRQKDVLAEIKTRLGRQFTSFDFQTVAWKYNLKKNPRYCWCASEGVLTKYSHETVTLIETLSESELSEARSEYRNHLRTITRRKAR
jgi:hypothetical protein